MSAELFNNLNRAWRPIAAAMKISSQHLRTYAMCLKRTDLRPTHLLRAAIFTAIVAAVAVPSARAQINIDPQRGVMTLAPVIAPIMPAVVQILIEQRAQDGKLVSSSSGSGVIIDSKEGFIISNHHVVGNATSIRVKLIDERIYDAKRIGSDAATDIGLLKISAADLVAIPIDSSSEVRVGDFVMAIGYPRNLGQTVTLGVVSGLGRAIGYDKFEDFIQTDAAINPGNSGGALIDTRGRLIGINTANVLAPGATVNFSIGLGLSVPIKIAASVVEQLKLYGEVRRGRFGVDFRDLTPELADAIGIRPTGGVLITRVPPGSLGQIAGIKTGDVVLRVNETLMRHAKDFNNIIGLSPVDTDLVILLIRDGQEITIKARLTKPEIAAAPLQFLGATFSALPEDSSVARNIAGVLVIQIEPDSVAAKMGLRQGDIVARVNRKETPSPDVLKKEIAAVVGNVLAMTVVRGISEMFVVFQR
jgi:S1-C subfamily serine protease